MKQVLYNYDIFPKAFLGDREQTITIQPLGGHNEFKVGHTYTAETYKLSESNPAKYPERPSSVKIDVTPDEDGCLRFTSYFCGEGEHRVNVYLKRGERPSITLAVYSLNEDMAGRIPQRGDLHVHTSRSDAKEAPETVCANYRGHGYDFMVISDHYKY